MSVSDAAVYIDSPIPSAVRQVSPFYAQGVFSNRKTPLFMRRRPGNAFGLLSKRSINGVDVTQVSGKIAKRLPVRKDGAIFYAFNDQGNLHTVANRSYRHVLVLHGESNKRASARPAARLYDYVCVAGDIAIDRYVEGGIFRQRDVEEQRLIRVGDTFVQSLYGYGVDPASADAVLYAPTWEGFGGEVNNYSSLTPAGIQMVLDAMSILDRKTLIIRPHPYLGMLRAGMVGQLVRGAIEIGKRYRVLFDLSDANMMVRAAVRAAMLAGHRDIGLAAGGEVVGFCICDISAMEAICLKERMPHFVLRKDFRVPSRVAPFYNRKSAISPRDLVDRLPSYIRDPEAVDGPHRKQAFSATHPDFLSPDGDVRINRLLKIVSDNEFWR